MKYETTNEYSQASQKSNIKMNLSVSSHYDNALPNPCPKKYGNYRLSLQDRTHFQKP